MEENSKEAILQRVKVLLEKHYKNNASELGRAIDMDPSTIGSYLNGRRGLSIDLIIGIVNRSNVSAEWLLRGEGSMEKGFFNQVIGRMSSCGDGDVFQEVNTHNADEHLKEQIAELKAEKERLLSIIEKLTQK